LDLPVEDAAVEEELVNHVMEPAELEHLHPALRQRGVTPKTHVPIARVPYSQRDRRQVNAVRVSQAFKPYRVASHFQMLPQTQ
jgi:hypothetical protein